MENEAPRRLALLVHELIGLTITTKEDRSVVSGERSQAGKGGAVPGVGPPIQTRPQSQCLACDGGTRPFQGAEAAR